MPRLTPQQQLERATQKLKDMGVTISVTPAPGVARPEHDVTATIAAAARAAGIYEEKSK